MHGVFIYFLLSFGTLAIPISLFWGSSGASTTLKFDSVDGSSEFNALREFLWLSSLGMSDWTSLMTSLLWNDESSIVTGSVT